MPGRTSLLVADGDRTQRSVALLAGEPAGSIATRTAGAVEFEAMLSWRRQGDVPPEPVLPELLRGATRRSVTETEGPETATTRRLVGEIRSFEPAELGSALEATLRSLTATAALTEALLEIEAVCTVPPRVAPRWALEELARELWSAGFQVGFGPSWETAPEADAYVGSGAGELQEFLRAHPLWSTA